MAIRSDDKIALIKSTGNDKPEYYTLDELNTFISAEESPAIATLQGQVGCYDPDVTESTITDDLEALQTEVEAETTGLLDRTTAAETSITALTPKLAAPVVATYGEAVYQSGEQTEIKFTAVDVGTAGNGITIDIKVPKTVESRIISVDGNTITVVVATELDGEAVIVSATETSTNILTAINEHAEAGLLVQGTLEGGGGLIAVSERVETAGAVDGTLAVAGEFYIDVTGSLLYICIADTDGTEEVLDSNWVTADISAIST